MPRRSAFQREHDLQIVAQRYMEGHWQADIARDLGVSQAVISDDLVEIRRRWKAQSVAAYDEHVAEQLAKIDAVEREAWAAWAKSKEPHTITNSSSREGGKAAGYMASVRTIDRIGNPVFLQGVLTCIERRCKLLGLDKPEKREHSGPNGGPVQVQAAVYDLSALTDEQLAVLDALVPQDAAEPVRG